MGCDIHFYVETKAADGSWKTADSWEPCEYEDVRITFFFDN